MKIPKGYALASDGQLARDQGAWGADKLTWVENYLGPALGATKGLAPRTHFVDLFSGPGMNVSHDSKTRRVVAEFEGSPLLALRARHRGRGGRDTHFGHFHFCNLMPRDYEALEARISAFEERSTLPVPRELIHHDPGDSNQLVTEVMARIPERDYVFAFLDIEGPTDLAFETIRTLKRGHPKVDLFVLFPTRLGIERMLAYDPCQADRFGEQFDRFFGTERWRTILEGRPTSSQAPELRTALLSLYHDQLLDHWAYAGTIMEVAGPRGKKYDMFAATDSEVGARIMRWAGKASQPPSLFD